MGDHSLLRRSQVDSPPPLTTHTGRERYLPSPHQHIQKHRMCSILTHQEKPKGWIFCNHDDNNDDDSIDKDDHYDDGDDNHIGMMPLLNESQ